MLIIRAEQIKSLAKAQERAYARNLAFSLAKRYPDTLRMLGLAGDALLQFVLAGIEKAKRYGIHGQLDVQLFVECTVELGLDFDRDPHYPWAQDTLNRLDLDGEQKMNLVHEHLIFDRRKP